MIQRIQSVFLLLVSGAAFSLFGLSFANSAKVIANSALFSDQTFNIMDDKVMLGLFCAAGALAFIAIFLFKNRTLQSRLAQLAILVILGGTGWGAYKFTQDAAAQASDAVQYSFGLASPVLAIIFAILAIRFIKKDENLVQSMDRLR
jgi:hypothetical protein